jgi:hypothetical protein
MPNTITHKILRERYLARIGNRWPGKSKDLQDLWMATNVNPLGNAPLRGRAMPLVELEVRAVQCVDCMFYWALDRQ